MDNKNMKKQMLWLLSLPVLALTACTAKEVESYTVTFYDSDGSVLSTSSVKEGDKLVAPTPKKTPTAGPLTGVFAGWDITQDGVVDTLPETVTADIIAVPIFTISDGKNTVEKITNMPKPGEAAGSVITFAGASSHVYGTFASGDYQNQTWTIPASIEDFYMIGAYDTDLTSIVKGMHMVVATRTAALNLYLVSISLAAQAHFALISESSQIAFTISFMGARDNLAGGVGTTGGKGNNALTVANVDLTGDAATLVVGGFGGEGEKGANNTIGVDGGAGGSALSATGSVTVSAANLILQGGDGGTGGVGGTGTNGRDAIRDSHSSDSGQNGEEGSDAGQGGAGGVGGIPLVAKAFANSSTNLTLAKGNGGNGGNGGQGGQGGNGGSCKKCCLNDGNNTAGVGAIGGKGGDGGDGGAPAVDFVSVPSVSGNDFLKQVGFRGNGGNGGAGGAGGIGGNGADDGTIYVATPYGLDGGRGGNGGQGGKGGAGKVGGFGGEGGAGGNGGKGTTHGFGLFQQYSKTGSAGASGTRGAKGADGEAVAD
jgi:hypothetical protein